MSAFELTASTRTKQQHGTGVARRMRRLENTIPAVVYGGTKEAKSISMNHDEIVAASVNEAFYSHILTLNIDGKAESVVIKAMQRHPYKHKILHADFLRVDAKQKLTMNVPLHFIGEENAPGVKNGGAVTHHMTDIEISCLPADLPEFIKVDISKLEMDQTLHLTDLSLPKGVEIVALTQEGDHNEGVVVIHEPKVTEEPAEAASEEAAEGQASTEEKPADDKPAEEKKD